MLKARLLTNDHALSQVARLDQVPALNLADLVRALRPNVMTGDEIELNLIKEGRESHQAIGYLPDGTMIVVNHGRPFVGKMARVSYIECTSNLRWPSHLCRAQKRAQQAPELAGTMSDV